MASLRDWYIGQLVTQADMRGADAALQQGDFNTIADLGFFGVISGHTVAAQGPPSLSIDVAAGLSYSPDGERIRSSGPVAVDTTFDYLGVPTVVPTIGHSRILSIFAVFDRAPSDPRLDATNMSVYFVQDESFRFIVVQGTESASPSPPALIADGVLLADITLAYGATTIVTGNLSTARRQDLVVLTGSPLGTSGTGGRYGSYLAALQAIVSRYDGLINGTGDVLAGASMTYAGSGTWVNGLAGIAAGTVESAIDAVVAALASTTTSTAGGDRLGVPSDATVSPTLATSSLTTRLGAMRLAANLWYAGGTPWVNSAANNAGTIEDTLDAIFVDLASVSNSGRGSGAAKVGIPALGNFTTTSVQQYFVELIASTNGNDGAKRIGANATGGFATTTVRAQLDELMTKFSPASSIVRVMQDPWIISLVGGSYALSFDLSNIPQSQAGTVALRLPDGATITSVSVRLIPADHTGTGLPGTMPKLTYFKADAITGTAATNSLNGTWTATDSSANATIYSAAHDLTLTLSPTDVIDRTGHIYWLQLTGEAGANKADYTANAARVTFTVATRDPGAPA